MCHFVSFNLIITETGWDVRTSPDMEKHSDILWSPSAHNIAGEWQAHQEKPDIRTGYFSQNIIDQFNARFPTRLKLLQYFFENYPPCQATLRKRGIFQDTPVPILDLTPHYLSVDTYPKIDRNRTTVRLSADEYRKLHEAEFRMRFEGIPGLEGTWNTEKSVTIENIPMITIEGQIKDFQEALETTRKKLAKLAGAFAESLDRQSALNQELIESRRIYGEIQEQIEAFKKQKEEAQIETGLAEALFASSGKQIISVPVSPPTPLMKLP